MNNCLNSIFFTSRLLLCLLLASGCADRGPESYYISPSGDDNNIGSARKPWRTLSRINSADLEPGDRVLLEGGAFFSGPLSLDSLDSGTGDARVIITSFGQGRAVIDGAGAEGITISDAEYFVIKDLIVRGNGRKSGNKSDGIVVAQSSWYEIDSVEVYGFQHSGLKIDGCRNARITRIYAHDNGFAGIHVTGENANHYEKYDNENLYIGYSVACNNPGDPSVLTNHSGNGILASSVSKGMIEHCEAFNNGWDMPWSGNGPVGIWIWDCTDFTVQYCISHNNKTNPVAKDGGGFDLDGGVSNSVIQHCISYNNQGPGYGLFEFGASKPWENNIVRYCLSMNDGLINEGSLAVWKSETAGSMKNCEIYNNKFVNDTLRGISLSLISNIDGLVFRDNLFAFSGSFLIEGQSLGTERFFYNCFLNIKGGEIETDALKGNSNFNGAPGLVSSLPGLLDSALLKLQGRQ